MHLIYTYSKKEWIDSRRKYLFLTKTLTSWQLISTLVFVGATGILIALTGFTIISIAAIIVALAYISVFILLYFWQPKHLLEITDQYRSQQHTRMSEEGIESTYTNGIIIKKWNEYKSCIKTDKYYYLVETKKKYFMFPIRIFEDEEIVLFEEYLRKNNIPLIQES